MTSQTRAQDAPAGSAIQLPGFGLPVTSMPELRLFNRREPGDEAAKAHDGMNVTRFPTAVMDWNADGVMLREREMLTVMDRLTDKPEWRSKVFNEEIVGKWRQEAPRHWSEGIFDFVSKRT